MVEIIKGTSNELTVTATENVTISNPFFLFVFKLRQSPTVQVKCLAVNTSTVTARYDTFTITDTATPDNTAGQVNFSTTGEWEYLIYQKSTNDLTIPLDSNIVERGICKVIGNQTALTAFEPNTIVKVYE